jgi:hypothetical protein
MEELSMKKLVIASFLTASLCSFAAFADEMNGYISDAHCGAKHDKVSAANTKCVETCLKGGADPVFVADGKVMKLDAASVDKAKSFAGQSVKVDGTVNGDTLTINSIDASK